MILYITKDSFEFKNRIFKHCSNGATVSTCEVESLYINIRQNLVAVVKLF